jgi:hypothetical protein
VRVEVNRNETKRPGEPNKKSSTAEEARIKSMQQQTRQIANSTETNCPNFISPGADTASCCFLPRLLQSILHRRRRFGYSTARHTSALTHHDQKRNAISAGTKILNFNSRGKASASCCFLPRLPQSILLRRHRFGCSPAQHTSALTHHDQKRNAISAGTEIPNCISQGPAAASCCFLSRLLQSILRRRLRLGCLPAQQLHTSALAQSSRQQAENMQQKRNRKEYYKDQCLHSTDFARFHPRGEQSKVCS